jgi:hypothetical protein
MKAGLLAQAFAALALQRADVRLRGDLILEAVVGEECMNHDVGVSATVDRGYSADLTTPLSMPASSMRRTHSSASSDHPTTRAPGAHRRACER